MKKKNIERIVLYVATFSLCCLISVECNSIRQSVVSGEVSMENRFFTLDFSDPSCEMSAVEKHFFTTFPHDDPTNGDVVYDRKKWMNENMIQSVAGDGLYLFIKYRKDDILFDSFRLTTKSFYNLNKDTRRILFVYKGTLPSAKGIWPAWWLNGSKQNPWIYNNTGNVTTDADLDTLSGKGHFYDTPSAVNGTDWPASGEVDIIETINGDSVIHNTIHTCPQMCDSEWNSNGRVINCANANSGDPNAGCSGMPYTVSSPEGTFACLWAKNLFKFFYWKPDADVRVPGGPLSERPDPDRWDGDELKNEVRMLETETECESDLHQEWQCKSCSESNSCLFTNMKMIFNATLCGKWAGRNFDESENALQNCRSFILGEGKNVIDSQFLKIEYVSVRGI